MFLGKRSSGLFLLILCAVLCKEAAAEEHRLRPRGIRGGRPPLNDPRSSNHSADVSQALPLHYMELAKSAEDMEAFRRKHNLTLVAAKPKEAALMPSWPQAFVQYLFIAPPIQINTRNTETHTVNGIVVYSYTSPSLGSYLMMFSSPILFVAWTVSFGFLQAASAGGGWISVLGWSSWLCLIWEGFGFFAVPPFLFQCFASLAVIIQRWRGDIGSVAYEITNLHGCMPHDGLDYLQQGARSRIFRIFQSVSFSYAVLAALGSGGRKEGINPALALIALAELILDCIMATRGTPMVVSGNCLLIELNPRLGFLDSGISTPWKALSSFMGF